jgi:hypothetical protein
LFFQLFGVFYFADGIDWSSGVVMMVKLDK